MNEPNDKHWTSQDKGCYIEKDNLNNEISVCISGGGLRAAVSACGWMNGLKEIGVTPKYISTVSGSSWFNLPYYYIDDIETYLGNYIEPENCTVENVTEFLNSKLSFESTIYNSDILVNMMYFQNWVRVISTQFFSPYDLHDMNIIGLQEIKKEKPYPIINSNEVILYDVRKFYPVEFTPLYHRYVCDDYFIKPHNLKDSRQISISEQASFSSGVIPAVFGAVRPPKLSLDLISNVSSLLLRSVVEPSNSHIYPRLHPFENKIIDTVYCDGGCSDNTGILPLIRRGEKKIICLYSCKSDVECSTFGNLNYTGDIAGLFGKAFGRDQFITRNISIDEYNKQRKIFDSSLYDEFRNKLIASKRNGDAVHCLFEGDVIPNSYVGVKQTYRVKILFILTCRFGGWLNKIPNELFEKLPKEFPNIPTIKNKYTPELIGGLKQMSSYQIVSLKDTIKNL